jgi:hypothetical protein
MSGWSDEEKNEALKADDRNFCQGRKVERDGMKVDSLLCTGNSLGNVQDIFAKAVKHPARIRLTIRQRTSVLAGKIGASLTDVLTPTSGMRFADALAPQEPFTGRILGSFWTSP